MALSFAELSNPGSAYLERLLAGEIQWAMQRMFRQYDTVAELLLPSSLVVEPQAAVAGHQPPPAEPQPQLNFEE